MSEPKPSPNRRVSPAERGHPRVLQEEIYSEVRRLIVSGALMPGDRLRELALAREFGTSQAPVREALRRLSQEGLVISVPHRGSFVAKPSLAEIEDVYLLRAEVESLAIRHFIVRAGDNAIGEIYRCLENMRVAIEVHDHTGGTDADMRFHRAICRGSGSSLLEDAWTTIDNRVRGVQAIVAPHSDLAKKLVDTHEPILRALARRDAHGAETLMRTHLEDAWTEIETLFPIFERTCSGGVA